MEERTIAGFRVLRELGSGSVGRVYLACAEEAVPPVEPGTVVALKVLHRHLLGDPLLMERFRREVALGQKVRHENVVRTLGAGNLDGCGPGEVFLVMEYVEGQTLRALLDELGSLPEELCRRIGADVARGLQAIHDEQAIHRDIKAENVLITRDHVVKVTDLSIALLMSEKTRLTMDGAVCGSLSCLSPEQIAGDGDGVDHRSDLYSLGVLLYELAAGDNPFRTGARSGAGIWSILHGSVRRLSERIPHISLFYDELVSQLMAKDRDRRPAAARLVAETLEQGEESMWWKSRSLAPGAGSSSLRRRIPVARETQFFGRPAELTTLRACFERARSGQGTAVLVEGEPGIGKSRLLDEFLARIGVSGDEVNLLYGSFAASPAVSPLSGFTEAFREHVGADRLPEAVASLLPLTPEQAPCFAALLSNEPVSTGEGPWGQEAIHSLFSQALLSLAAERTTVLFLDDLHLASPNALALFASQALTVGGRRVLLLATARLGQIEDWAARLERLGVLMRVPLAGLDTTSLRAILADALGSDTSATEILPRIADHAIGSPFVLLQTVRALRADGILRQGEDGVWRPARPVEAVEVPGSVAQIVRSRLAALDDQCRTVLLLAACCGQEFDVRAVSRAGGFKSIETMTVLARLERRHRLVRQVGRAFTFEHQQVREALYADLSDGERRDRHLALAKAVEELAGTPDGKMDPGAAAVDVCRHLLAADAGARSLRYLEPALARLEATGAHQAAAEMIAQVLAKKGLVTGRERTALLLRQAGRYEYLGQRNNENAAIEAAAAEPVDEPALRARVEHARGRFLLRVERHGQARDALGRALDLARTAGDERLQAGITSDLGLVLAAEGRFLAAGSRYRESLAILRRHGDLRGEVVVVGKIGLVLSALGRLDEAAACFRRTLDGAKESGDPLREVIASGGLGSLIARQGRHDLAEPLLEASLATARRIGYRRGQGYALHDLADSFRDRGHFAQAEDHYRQALEVRRAVGYPTGIAATAARLGAMQLERSRIDEAGKLLREALSRAVLVRHAEVIVTSAVHLARLPGGDIEAARIAFAEYARRAGCMARMEALYHFFTLTGKRDYLLRAGRILKHVARHAFEPCRESILTAVPLHRAILEGTSRPAP